MILHIATDEKFIDSAIYQFECIRKNENRYIIINNSSRLKYIKSKNPNIKIYPDSNQSIDSIIDEMYNKELIVFHGLDYFKNKVILKSSPTVKIMLLFWGKEVYQYHPKFKYIIYDSRTKRIVFKNIFIDKIKELLKPIVYKFTRSNITPREANIKALLRVNYFGSGLKTEFNYLKNLEILSSSYFKYLYYPLEYILGNKINKHITGNNILLGNSASASNNHLEAFDFFNDIDIKDKKVYIPLSYGDSQYAKKIETVAHKLFSSNSLPLKEFLPIEEYNSIQLSCRYLVLNNYRQQAMGNIVISLWMGAKVFLNKRNILFKSFQDIGITIFDIESLGYELQIDKPLSADIINQNRQILKKEFGEDELLCSLSSLLEQLRNETKRSCD